MHFTHDINDFVDYQVLEEKIVIRTATSNTDVIGKVQ